MIENLMRMFQPNKSSLMTEVTGPPGSGKTYFLENTLAEYLKADPDPLLRVVIISPKHEDYVELLPKRKKSWLDSVPFLERPERKGLHFDADSLLAEVPKQKLTVLYPDPMITVEETETVINGIFDLKESNKDLKAVVIIDDAQTFFRGPRTEPTDGIKRLVLTGRSKQIRGILVSHRPVNARMLDGNSDLMVAFKPVSFADDNHYKERWGIDMEEYRSKYEQYGFIWADARTDGPVMYGPI